jgi:uncharacterized protein (UPF0335 family)
MPDTATATIDREALNRYVGRVLELHNERAELNASIAEVYEEAKNAGFVTKIIRQIVTEQKMEADERNSHYALLDTYRHALGMLADTPLGTAALERVTPIDRPTPVAQQPIKPSRSRSRKADAVDDMIDTANRIRQRRQKPKSLDELLDNARQHLGETAGTA